MNEYPFGDEENTELDVEPEAEMDDSVPDPGQVPEGPTGDRIRSYRTSRANKHALQVRRAIELHHEHAALRQLIEESFNQP